MKFILYSTHLFVILALLKLLSFDNKNKRKFYFVLFSLNRNFVRELTKRTTIP